MTPADEAVDPGTSPARLAELAYEHPELRAAVAVHPAVYPGLRDWLAALGDPAVDAALGGAEAPAPAGDPVPEPMPAAVTEPDAPAADAPVPDAAAPDTPASDDRPVPIATTPRAWANGALRWLRAHRPLAIGIAASVVVVVAVAIGIGAAAGGTRASEPTADRHPTSTTPRAQQTPSAVSTPTEAPSPPPSVYTDSGHVWAFANKSGYSYEMRIALGTPIRFEKGDQLPGTNDAIGDACSIDPKTDVVIPMRWTATATTTGYDTPISMRALISSVGSADYAGAGIAPFDGDDRVQIEQYFSSGPSCSTESSTNIWGYAHSSGFSVQWKNPVAAGSSVASYVAIIVKNYYTPATPQGDSALLDWIGIRPLFGGDNSDAATEYLESGNTYLGIYSNAIVALDGRLNAS